jgi:hypothetical protein
MVSRNLDIPQDRIADFCQRWQVSELAIFGSALREDFGPDSDVDVLITFAPGARWGLFDMVHMRDELERIFGRSVDLLSKRGVEQGRNPLRREAILASAEAVYVQR